MEGMALMSCEEISRIGIPGRQMKTSTTRIMTISTQPPKKPARPPKMTPSSVSRKTTRNASVSDTRPPYIKRTSTSIRLLSVPSGCSADGGALSVAVPSVTSYSSYVSPSAPVKVSRADILTVRSI